MDLSAYGGFLAGWKRMAALAGAAGLCAALLAQGASAGGAPAVVRFGGDRLATRIVIDLAQSATGKLISGGEGARELVLDFPKLDVAASEGRGQGLVGAYNITKTAGGTRLKLALNETAVVDRRFLLAPAEGVKNYRYVIDLKAHGGVKSPAPRTPSLVPAPAPPPVSTAVKPAGQLVAVAPAPRSVNLRKVIVIDAGHGGHDPGALGANAREKDITLAAAKALKKRLEATGRYRAVMTRDGDAYIPLENRVQIARRAGADLFISLHADAGGNKSTRGASVYTLSDEGSAKVARSVNTNSDWFIDVDVPGGAKAVREILFDLTQRATRNRSAAFAELLIDKVGDEAPLLTRAHRDARYVVLFAPDVPAVLLEMGFITNSADERLLTDPDKRAKVVDAIAGAIDEYFEPQLQLAAR